jgi:hypothetical protein
MPVPQIILFLDTQGVAHAESVGKNGSRLKINLPSDFLSQNSELHAEFIRQQDEIRAHEASLQKAASARDSRPIIEDGAALAKRVRDAKEARFTAWIDSLPADEATRQLIKREEIQRKRREEADAQARTIWHRVARDHSIELADRVISDPARRPNQRVLVKVNAGGAKVTYNPRYDSKPKTEKSKRVGSGSTKNAIDLGDLL